MTLPATNRVGDLVRGLLDRGYEQAAGATLRAVASSVSDGVVAQRLAELEAESARLAEAGERLKPDNPVLRALLADLEPVLQRNVARIDAGATDAQTAGIRAAGTLTRELAMPGISDEQLRLVGMRWNVPDPEAVNALVGYVESGAWAEEIERYPKLVLETVRNQAIRGFVEGWGPIRTAREIRRVSEGLTVAQANNLMRTVQLVSYRQASAIHQRANEDILTGQVRIATLDSRTCIACIALHGQPLRVGEVVVDHHQGRCVGVAIVRGRDRRVQTGEQWFAAQDEATRRRIAGDAGFELLQSGRARLRDFVEPYDDPVFGEMMRAASVKGVLSRLS